MIAVEQRGSALMAPFGELIETARTGDASWLVATREAAGAHFSRIGLPTTNDEEWRYTNVTRVAETSFQPWNGAGRLPTRDAIASRTLQGVEAHLLVFVGGRYEPTLSAVGSLPEGVKVTNLGQALRHDRALIEPHLARYAASDGEGFVALNTALFQEGALVHVPAGTVVDRPIQLLYVSPDPASPAVCHPRNLIVMGEESRATVVESYAALAGGVYFTNVVTEIGVADRAVLDHYNVQCESDEAYHIATRQLHLGRDCRVTSRTMTFGGALVRNDVNAVLAGEESECALDGLYIASGTQHVDNHLRVDHAKARCRSRECYNGILEDQARGVFSGRIVVREDSQQTDAKQTNKSLLLSETARVESKPQLEIYADDVKCTHGATVGQLDEDALYYLRTRGLSADAARSLLIYAFARERIEEIGVEPLKRQLTALLMQRLPHAELLGRSE